MSTAINGAGQQPANSTPEVNGGKGSEKVFTQEEVNRIVSERLARERERSAQQPPEDEREKALKAREARMDCREYLDRKRYPASLLDILDSADAERFEATVDALAEKFPGVFLEKPAPAPYAVGTGAGMLHSGDPVADAFKPPEF